MSLTKVVLLACGSFNPPTNMHLRMFELAKDHLHRLGNYLVVGGFMSPVHDSYGKADLVAVKHRLAMLRLSLEDNSWIAVSDWESQQETWTRTRVTLNHHQNVINSRLNSLTNGNANMNENEDFPDNYSNLLSNGNEDQVQVKLLCGADLLESFGTPGLWADEDIETIVGQYGLVVITRENTNPLKFIYNSDILTKHMGNIVIVTEWITNEVSSTKIRRALRRAESVKYLIPDKVIEYIQDHALFGTSNRTKYLLPPTLRVIPNNRNNNNNRNTTGLLAVSHHSGVGSLTPSPTATSDMSIDTPSPISCMNLCNSNLFAATATGGGLSPSPPATVLSIDVPDAPKCGTNASRGTTGTTGGGGGGGGNVRHPGQAVKIVTAASGAHRVIRGEVCTISTTPTATTSTCTAIAAPPTTAPTLKGSQSCTELAQLRRASREAVASRSNDDLLDRKSCDANLIKFIFTKHGIQVISDVETIV